MIGDVIHFTARTIRPDVPHTVVCTEPSTATRSMSTPPEPQGAGTGPTGSRSPQPACPPRPPPRAFPAEANRVTRTGLSPAGRFLPIAALERLFSVLRPRRPALGRGAAGDDLSRIAALIPTAPGALFPSGRRAKPSQIGKPVSSHFPAGFQPRKTTPFPKLAPNSPPWAIFASCPRTVTPDQAGEAAHAASPQRGRCHAPTCRCRSRSGPRHRPTRSPPGAPP